MEKVIFFCIFWLQLEASWDDYNIEHKKTFLAREASHVKMEGENRDTKLRIEFPRTPEELITNFHDDTIRNGYKYTRNGSVGIFEILNLTEKRSGSYEFFFVNETGGGVEYSIEVILAELQCGLNYPMNYIGDTDCQEVEKEKIDGWCHLKISQKPKLHVPIKWGINKKNRDLMNVTYSNESYVEGYEVDLPLSSGEELNCYASTLQCSISFSPTNITYARNKTSRELTSYKIRPMTSDNKQNIVCEANVSKSVHCSYEWTVKDGDFIGKFHQKKLKKEDFVKDGTYVCIASCKLKGNPASKCRLLADRVDFSAQIKSSESSAAYVILIVLAIVFVPSPFVLLCLYYYRKLSSERHKLSEGGYKEVDTNELMEEKENFLGRLNQAENLLEAEKRICRKLKNLEEKELRWSRYLEHPSELEYDLSEIVGLDDIKKEIREKILEPLKNHDKRLHKRVLVHGPSWWDKREWIQATAKSAEMGVFDYYALNFVEDNEFKAAISMLRKMQTVIVHVYNISLKDLKRLLNEITPQDKIIVMVQTRNIKDIDSDVFDLFSLKIEIPLPDKDRRIGIMRHEIKRKEIQISNDIDWDKLSNRLEGRNFNDLRIICNKASERAKERRGENAILMMEDMEDAIKELKK